MNVIAERHSSLSRNTISAFRDTRSLPSDPIFGLWSAYQADKRQQKINLGVGVFVDGAGQIPLLTSIRQVEVELASETRPKSYLPMEGRSDYRELVSQLIFGFRHQALCDHRVATVQTIGGSGAVRVGAEFLRKHFPQSIVYLSDPTWDNHRAFFQAAGMQTGVYPYYDAASATLRFGSMLQALSQLPPQSVIVMQPCCHNPTGVDLTAEQWDTLAPLLLKNQLIVFMDMAYQGFGQGLGQDTYAIKLLADKGVSMLVSTSFSKNMALYGERCGSLSVVCESAADGERVLSQLKSLIRGNYSSPPMHGSLIVERTLSDLPYRTEWESELDSMRRRIQNMRLGLHDRLIASKPHLCPELLKQRGMFSLLCLSEQQVAALRVEFGIYMLGSGRCCLAALTPDNLTYVADALASVTDSSTHFRGELHA